MHDTAMYFGRSFFEQYARGRSELTVVDIGAQDVNGSLRSVAPAGCNYIGVDFQQAKGVDVIMSDPYKIPLADDSADICVSSSCFEHSEFFWVLFLEVLRVLKPGGLFYLDVPSNGMFHRFPVDCWRFYPDSALALERWARRNGVACTVLESFVGNQQQHGWNDYVAVFFKGDLAHSPHSKRILDLPINYTNGILAGVDGVRNFSQFQEDQTRSVFQVIGKSVKRSIWKMRGA